VPFVGRFLESLERYLEPFGDRVDRRDGYLAKDAEELFDCAEVPLGLGELITSLDGLVTCRDRIVEPLCDRIRRGR